MLTFTCCGISVENAKNSYSIGKIKKRNMNIAPAFQRGKTSERRARYSLTD